MNIFRLTSISYDVTSCFLELCYAILSFIVYVVCLYGYYEYRPGLIYVELFMSFEKYILHAHMYFFHSSPKVPRGR